MQYRWTKKYEFFFFLLLLSIVFARVLANFNNFNYSISVWLPVVFIPVSLLYGLGTLKIKKSINTVKIESILYILIIGFLVSVPFLQMIFFQNLIDSEGRYSHNYILVTSSLAVSWMLAGSVVAKVESSLAINVILLFYFILSLFYLYTGLDGGYFIDYYSLSSLRNDDIKIHHLSLTEPLTYIIFLTLSFFIKKNYIKWLALLLMTYIMLALGGRVSFFSFVFTIFFYEFLISDKRFFLAKLSFIIFILLIIIYSLKGLFIDSDAYKKIFFEGGIGQDSSLEARLDFFSDFNNGILSQFLIGNVNYFIERHNTLGSYAHNILSVFQFYGTLSFLTIIYTFYYIFKKIFYYKIYESLSPIDTFGFLLLVYSFISILVGKAVLFSPMWFVIGFWLIRLRLFKVKNYV